MKLYPPSDFKIQDDHLKIDLTLYITLAMVKTTEQKFVLKPLFNILEDYILSHTSTNRFPTDFKEKWFHSSYFMTMLTST